MKREERMWWVEHGYKDPYAAFLEHKASAEKRGIEFRLEFDQWWGLWEPHYEKRGSKKGQMCMCRTHDEGAYEVGNVRIDTNKGNQAEAGMMRRSTRASSAYLQNRERYRLSAPDTSASWIWHNRFAPYEEELDEDG